MKEAYVKPTVKSEVLKAEVLWDNQGSGCTNGNVGQLPGRGHGYWWWWCPK